jgi:xylulose-5-phosphate/fructose-6-phosphate phosphoketolase
MVVLNEMSRYHLAKEALRRSALDSERVSALTDELDTAIADSVTYAWNHFEDPPHIRDWVWSGSGS